MTENKSYEKYTRKALEVLTKIIEYSEDEKIKISAAKELLNITAEKKTKDGACAEPVRFVGEVEA